MKAVASAKITQNKNVCHLPLEMLINCLLVSAKQAKGS